MALRPSIARGLPLSGEDLSVPGCTAVASENLSASCISFESHVFVFFCFGLPWEGSDEPVAEPRGRRRNDLGADSQEREFVRMDHRDAP